MSASFSITDLNPRRVFESLCQKCQAFSSAFNTSYTSSKDPRPFDHHENFLSLQASADAGCPLCQLIWQYVVWDCQLSEPFQNLLMTEWRYEGSSIKVRLTTTNPSSNIFPAYEPPPQLLALGVEFPPPSYHDVGIPTIELVQEYLQEMKTISIKESMPGPENEDLKELIRTEIWPWIRNCESQHPQCAASVAAAVPTRLIDVGLDGDEMVKLIQTDQKALEYIALSYCWGKGTGNSKARTTSKNLQSRLNGIWMKDLPASIQDAIIITRLMEVKYIWIDAICIVQSDGPNDPGDWATEAGRMGDYYSGSLCCIAASCANSSTEGFLRARTLGRFKIKPVPVPFRDENGWQRYVWAQLRPTLDSARWTYRVRHPLMERGWCLQERVLSRRVLHWTLSGLFKECRMTHPLIESDQPKEMEKELVRHHILSLSKREALGEAWCELVRDYSNMKLSFASDRMVAISGVATLLSRKHHDDYFYGAFRSSLAECLLWWSSEDSNTEYPGWSWLSVMKNIDFPTLSMANTRMEQDTRQSLIRQVLPNPFPKSHGLTSPGSRLEQTLEIEAPLIELELAEQMVPYHLQVKIPGTSRLFAGWDCLYQGRPVEGKARGSGGAVDVVLLLGGREYNGLVLTKKSEKEWERAGIITIRSEDETAVQSVEGFIRKVVLV
ncbi:HET domain-containing protein [Fusarium sp. Ph1]|nr:HET domain-containing protein [Fusarium sp. Ph1]